MASKKLLFIHQTHCFLAASPELYILLGILGSIFTNNCDNKKNITNVICFIKQFLFLIKPYVSDS
jgi:hypothetical protein